MTRVFASALVVACCAVAALPAGAATKAPKYLWATVNVCDTQLHANMMGVRASMPGDGDRTRMYMRFVAQYYDASRQLWSEAGKHSVSRWIYVGLGISRWRQAGYTFAFDPPRSRAQTTLRGAVDFKWVKGRRIVRTAHVVTKRGHRGTKGADPAGYSASLCTINWA